VPPCVNVTECDFEIESVGPELIVSVSVPEGELPPPPDTDAAIDCGLVAPAETLKFRVNTALPPAASAGEPVLLQVNEADGVWQVHPVPGGVIDAGTIALALLNVKVTVTVLLVAPAPLPADALLTVTVAVSPVLPCLKVPAGLPLSTIPTLRTGS